jgi:hypothetical protein
MMRSPQMREAAAHSPKQTAALICQATSESDPLTTSKTDPLVSGFSFNGPFLQPRVDG